MRRLFWLDPSSFWYPNLNGEKWWICKLPKKTTQRQPRKKAPLQMSMPREAVETPFSLVILSSAVPSLKARRLDVGWAVRNKRCVKKPNSLFIFTELCPLCGVPKNQVVGQVGPAFSGPRWMSNETATGTAEPTSGGAKSTDPGCLWTQHRPQPLPSTVLLVDDSN